MKKKNLEKVLYVRLDDNDFVNLEKILFRMSKELKLNLKISDLLRMAVKGFIEENIK